MGKQKNKIPPLTTIFITIDLFKKLSFIITNVMEKFFLT